jgi:hypothetical protein
MPRGLDPPPPRYDDDDDDDTDDRHEAPPGWEQWKRRAGTDDNEYANDCGEEGSTSLVYL